MNVDSLLVIGVGAASFAGAVLMPGRRGQRKGATGLGLGRLGEYTHEMAARLFAGISVSGRSSERVRSECLREMPTMIDILTLGLSAGLSFNASLELYCRQSDGLLARRFDEAMLEWRIGVASRSEALTSMADDLDVAALRSFSSVVGEALTFGTPLAESLERQAQLIRDQQRSEVEEQIEKVPVKMLVPLGTLIVPAMLIAILGPLLGSAATIG